MCFGKVVSLTENYYAHGQQVFLPDARDLAPLARVPVKKCDIRGLDTASLTFVVELPFAVDRNLDLMLEPG